MNGNQSDIRTLDQAGLPQGSPLSAGSYNFFNADLVQRRIDANGGAIAFIDDFTAWVTGPTAHSNRDKIQAIIEEALEWESRSGEDGHHTLYTQRTISRSDSSRDQRTGGYT